MSPLTLSLLLSFALPSSEAFGEVSAGLGSLGEGAASMIHSSIARRVAMSVDLEVSPGEAQRVSPPVEREPGDVAPTPVEREPAGSAPLQPSLPSQPLLPSQSPPPEYPEYEPMLSKGDSNRGAFVFLTLLGLTVLVVGVMPRGRKCRRCGGELVLLGEESLLRGERAEQRLGSVRYTLRQCKPCGVIYRAWKHSALRGTDACPDCGFHTLVRKITQYRDPTAERAGVERVEVSCTHCDYLRASEETLPQLEIGAGD